MSTHSQLNTYTQKKRKKILKFLKIFFFGCKIIQKSDDDIVIVSGIRTAIGKAKRGSFRNTTAVRLLTEVFKYVTKDIDPSIVDDICVGTVLAPGGLRANES